MAEAEPEPLLGCAGCSWGLLRDAGRCWEVQENTQKCGSTASGTARAQGSTGDPGAFKKLGRALGSGL